MTLDTLHTQIDSIRAEAASAQRTYGSQVQNVNSDTSLSAEGKAAQKQQISANAKAALSALRAKETAAIDMKVRDIEKVLDSKVGSTATDIIAFRDAQDRAERFENPEDATKALERALRTEDRVLAHAIFRRGIESNWRPVIAAFGNANPDKKDVVTELAYLRDAQNNTLGRAMHYMWMNA
jgi:hypothetical protein